LLLYVVVLGVGIVVAALLRRALRGPAAESGRELPELSPYEIASLSGGRKWAVDAAIAALVQRGALELDKEAHRLRAPTGTPSPDDPLERAVFQAVASRRDGATVREVRRDAGHTLSLLEDRLTAEGLRVSPGRKLLVRVLPFATLLAIGLFGFEKLRVGIAREKPILLLGGLLAVTGLVALVFLAKRIVRSRRGDDVLARLKAEHQALRATAASNPEALGQNELMLAMCLFGMGVIAIGPLSDVHRMLLPPAAGGSGCGGAACGASGCGGPGGGCGGGGCGGCGGGGD
jgi:uncharacterized protein (TIGR04222 family)